MQWIQENGATLFGIIGALYTAARLIVYLTPTPKDDQVVGVIGNILAKVAKAFGWTFGLTMDQGVRAKKIKRIGKDGSPVLTLLLCFLLVTSGCLWAQSPRADLLASQKIFAATVESLTTASQAGQIGDDEIEIIDGLIQTGNSVLKAWEKAMLEEREVSDALMETFQDILADLIAWQTQVNSE